MKTEKLSKQEEKELHFKLLCEEMMHSLTTKENTKMYDWITTNLQKTDGPAQYNSPNSYQLKHIMEREIGLYVTNNVFKAAMLDLGYRFLPSDMHHALSDCCNMRFNVSKKSPVLKWWKKARSYDNTYTNHLMEEV
ncbi:MAG: hypothetical protein K2P14_03605 [Anaeroplasmataceae bacterium]|nr:hypothetical protein [Anaeroplasmataceae bacterium]